MSETWTAAKRKARVGKYANQRCRPDLGLGVVSGASTQHYNIVTSVEARCSRKYRVP